MNEVVKKIVNNNYDCDKSPDKDYCKFCNGSDDAKYASQCYADGFAKGVHRTMAYLNSIPWNEAMEAIFEYNKYQQNE